MKIVEARSVEDFLDKYYKADRYEGRGKEYADYLLQSYQVEYKRRGFVCIGRHCNVTGVIIAWPYYPE